MTGDERIALVMGTFDSKAEEFEYLIHQIEARNVDVITLNCGILGSTDLFRVDHEVASYLKRQGIDIEPLRQSAQRDQAMQMMAEASAAMVKELFETERLDGVVGMGGGCGTSIVTAAMRSLPLGVPKLCVSTVARGDVSAYVGISDIVLFPCLVDINGLNRLSRGVLSRAAGAFCGLMEGDASPAPDDRPIIFISAFGNTAPCVSRCAALLAEQFESIVFHATGSGGRTMESLIGMGMADGVLDLTTTELADLVCGGAMSAGEERLDAAGARGLPQVIAPGCVDMVNFGVMESVPKAYRDTGRIFYRWNPSVTLMRTDVAENIAIGRILAQKANAARGPVAILLPSGGVSALGAKGQPFYSPLADRALFETIKNQVSADVPVIEMEANINDAEFADRAVAWLSGAMAGRAKRGNQ